MVDVCSPSVSVSFVGQLCRGDRLLAVAIGRKSGPNLAEAGESAMAEIWEAFAELEPRPSDRVGVSIRQSSSE